MGCLLRWRASLVEKACGGFRVKPDLRRLPGLTQNSAASPSASITRMPESRLRQLVDPKLVWIGQLIKGLLIVSSCYG
jgi:hypothetical protein